jgi:prefoldin subunit 5
METRLSKEREQEFFRLKNLQANLAKSKPIPLKRNLNSEEYSDYDYDSEPKEVEYFTQWEKQVNTMAKPNEIDQKKILAQLLKGESTEPENIIKTSMDINKNSMFLMNKREQQKRKFKVHNDDIDNGEEYEENGQLGDTHQILEFCEKRIEKYSQEKEELWAQLNKVTSQLTEKEEALESYKTREKKLRNEKRLLENKVGELEVEMGRELQKAQEMQMEVDRKEEELQELRKFIEQEKAGFEEQKSQLNEAVERINGEKMEIQGNAEKINQKNLELQDFIDNQEVSLGRLYCIGIIIRKV